MYMSTRNSHSPSAMSDQIATTHILAASGDTILTLKNPNASLGLSKDDKGNSDTSPSSPSATPRPVTFRVSSQHLIQASSVFKAALTGSWKERSVSENGCREISAEDWSTEAMRIVLSLIHNRTRDIPRTVSLDLLVKIAILVDYYELHEAVHFFAIIWIDALRPSVPKVYGGDVMLWICLSWVFRDAPIFTAITKLAIQESPGKVPTDTHLPIPSSVLGRFCGIRGIMFLNGN